MIYRKKGRRKREKNKKGKGRRGVKEGRRVRDGIRMKGK
jgi:hypothetical protein